MTPRTRLRLPLTAAAATAIALVVAGPASAHVHTSPSAVQAGTENTVGFTVEHGCEGSPTTKMEIQLPEGSSGIAGVDGNGFTSSVDGQVVTFSGGEVADGTEATFEVTFTAPDEPGDVPVKVIQTCTEGVNEWIEVQADGEAEPESPAPVLSITEGAPSETDGEHGHDEGTSTEHDHAEEPTTTEAGDHDHAEEPTTTVAVAPVGEAAGDDDGDDSSSMPLVIGGIAAVVVIGGGGALYARSRSARTED
ncbi:MAG: DUF1775 domain-containing protein [Acidimicrobiales bacterium]